MSVIKKTVMLRMSHFWIHMNSPVRELPPYLQLKSNTQNA
jgi:hypothetical protein